MNEGAADAVEAGASPANAVLSFVRTVAKSEFGIAIAICLILTTLLVSMKVVDVRDQWGDTAIYLQLTENLAHGHAASQTFSAVSAFMFGGGGYLRMQPEEYRSAALPLLSAPTDNPLRGHEYYILYPAALLANIVPANVILMTLFVVSFTGLLLLAYWALRRQGVSVAATLVFCLLLVCSPAWTESLFGGQFFPDRLFMFAAFAFLYLATRSDTPKWLVIVAAVLCASVNERGALIAGVALLAYVGLYWKASGRDRKFDIILGIALLAFGAVMMKFILSDVYYSHYMALSFKDLAKLMSRPYFWPMTALFLTVNLPLLLLAAFEYRTALIAVLVMLPNIFGTIGGAEKIGWSSHYHSYYFPVLAFAAYRGYVALYRRVAESGRTGIVYGAVACAVLLLGMLNPYSFRSLDFGPRNLVNNPFTQFTTSVATYLGPRGREMQLEARQLREAVPQGSIVTTPESGMPLLYHNRTIQVFPMAVDSADYAVLRPGYQDGLPVYRAADTLLGPKAQDQINAIVQERMKRDGYDFAHVQTYPALGIAVVKRVHG